MTNITTESGRKSLDPRVVTLGTAGGPRWWPAGEVGTRAGIATAVVVGNAVYIVDAGHGVGRQMSLAGLTLASTRAILLTHLHSDHTIDLNSLLVFGLFTLQPGQPPVRILGPGDRGVLPPLSPRATVPPSPLFPDDPTPGTAKMVEHLLRAHATDLNDRILDALRPSPGEFFLAEDIRVPASAGYHPNSRPTPAGMAPFEVYRDDLVVVTATLVEHPPIAPAFAFRFDTAEGSVTISGDTAPCQNLVRLAQGTDLLLHEAIDFAWVEATYGGSDGMDAASIDHHRRSHTSAADAGRIAAAAGAKALALHHIVPGSASRSVFQEAGSTYRGPVHVPDDLDVVPFGVAHPSLPTDVLEGTEPTR